MSTISVTPQGIVISGGLYVDSHLQPIMMIAGDESNEEHLYMIQQGGGSVGPQGNPGVQGKDGLTILPDDPYDPVEPIIAVGPQGPQGNSGPAGINGKDGITMFWEPEFPMDPWMIPGAPGPQGIQGNTGNTGLQGAPGIALFLEPEYPDEPMLIPGLKGDIGPQGPSGSGSGSSTIMVLETGEVADDQISPIRSPELDLISPKIGRYAPGSFFVSTECYAMMARRLQLKTTERVTAAGTSRITVYG